MTEEVLVAHLRGFELMFATKAGVFSKKGLDAGSRLLIDCLEITDGTRIADLGCGTGVLGMTCALLNPHGTVDLLDDHLRAVELARQNVARNQLPNASVYLSDLFSAVESVTYDQIVTNLPAQLGNEFLAEAVAASHAHLAKGGTLWIVVVKNLRPVIERLLTKTFGGVALVERGSQHAILQATR